MGAQLISPDGKITELSVEEYIKAKFLLISELPTQGERLRAIIDLIRETTTEEDIKLMNEIQREIDENRKLFPGRELDFGND